MWNQLQLTWVIEQDDIVDGGRVSNNKCPLKHSNNQEKIILFY